MSNQFKSEFFETLSIIKDYLPDIVIAGGWAPLIYYHYLLSDKTRVPLRTVDIDIVVPGKLRKRKSKTIDTLLTEAGFKTRFKSRHQPPVISYEGKIGDFDAEIEFLTHRRSARDGQVAVVQDGLHAQMLRFINILLENNITLDIDDYKMSEGILLQVRVPTLGAFIFQKGLTFPRRTRPIKKAKDLYYIFDILANCENLHQQILEEIVSFNDVYPASWFKQFKRYLSLNFSDVDKDGVLMIQSQRPENAYPAMNEQQFQQYVFGIFQEFIANI